MSVIAVLALIGLCLWCGALSRRAATLMCPQYECQPRDRRETEEVEAQLADLTDAYHQLERDLEARVMDLEERLDFAERMLAEPQQRAHLVMGE